MNKLLRQLNKESFKEDSRKLGINLLTASFIAGFITHASQVNWGALVLIMLIGTFGIGFWLIGLHRRGK